MCSLDVDVEDEATSKTLSDDSTSTTGAAMTVEGNDDDATVTAPSVGADDEAIVIGELLILMVTSLRLITCESRWTQGNTLSKR